MLKILLVEDDHIQCGYVVKTFATNLNAEVTTKACESEFQRDFESIASNPPDVAILDIMLRWASPSRTGNTAPSDLTPYHAGLRCARALESDPRTRNVKIVLYSVFPKEDFADSLLPQDATFVVKEPNCQNLIDAVNDLQVAGAAD